MPDIRQKVLMQALLVTVVKGMEQPAEKAHAQQQDRQQNHQVGADANFLCSFAIVMESILFILARTLQCAWCKIVTQRLT